MASGDEVTKSELPLDANRYLGISLMPDKEVGGLERARLSFKRAGEFVDSVRSNSRDLQELNARLLGNRGHLELEHGDVGAALPLYKKESRAVS